MNSPNRYVFGPSPSRRLGRSLGVDLIPIKTCSYDCVYCQIGRTTDLTLERKDHAPLEQVIGQLEQKLAAGPAPDVVTLSGSGEPTLHLGVGEAIRAIKKLTTAPVAVLTNGSLLWDPAVRAALLPADLVIPDLDAGSAEAFAAVCRPAAGLSFARMVEGLIAFGQEYRGRLWLEVFLVAGQNDGEAEVRAIARLAEKIGAARVQLNTVTRPPAESLAAAVPGPRLSELAHLFSPPAEPIGDFAGPAAAVAAAREDDVLQTLARRPCSIEDLSHGLSAPAAEVSRLVAGLLAQGLIEKREQNGKDYYLIKPPASA